MATSRPTFTALNGSSPTRATATDGTNGGAAEPRGTASEERRKDAPPAISVQTAEPLPSTRDDSPGRPRERERLDRESDLERERERKRVPERGPSREATELHPGRRLESLDTSMNNKRKRVSSPAPRRERSPVSPVPGHHQPKEVAEDGQSPAGSPDAPSPEDGDYRERDREGQRERGSRYPLSAARDDWGPNYEQVQSAVPDSAVSEFDPIGESLSRPSRQMESIGETAESPEDDQAMSAYPGHYTPEQRRDGVVQSDSAKRRKRIFSNRTKTGCLTCRKRKKKCDEAKPECGNCLRGGFVCAGYLPQRGSWPKPEVKPTTVQIESKDPTYVPPGAYGMPQQPPYAVPPPAAGQTVVPQPVLSPQRRDSLSNYRGPSLRIEPPQGRLLSDDERPAASTIPSLSVTTADKLPPVPTGFPGPGANPFPTPISAFPDRKEYQRVPPLHDLSRTEPSETGPGSSAPLVKPSLRQINILHGNTQVLTPDSAGPQSGVRATAQMALSHTFASPVSAVRRREKEEMLAGKSYYPFDKELVLERERCSSAVWRFNNSTNPNNGVSPTERARLFREILQPREGVQISPTQTSLVTHSGRVGEGVVVEAPFACDYGYNIKIGTNVVVGRNCTLNDASNIVIGDNTIISPNVSIYTSVLPIDPRHRPGSHSQQTAKPVCIESDVWIGANVVILPGVTIGHGTTVGAGSVVTKDLPSRHVCFGSPAVPRRQISLIS